MTPPDLATRRLWIGIPGPVLDQATRSLLLDVRPGGIVLFRRNVESVEQVRALNQGLGDLLGDRLLISVDHEGGLVTRFHRELTVFPGNMALGAAGFRELSLGEHLAAEQGELSARELRDLGIHVNLAPVLDLASRGSNPGITIRSFGESPELVSALGAALVRGTLRGGVHPTLKHFPGKGDATVDAHLDLPVIEGGAQGPHLLPFRRCIAEGAPVIMTSHVIYRELDRNQPATLSPAVVTGLLRKDLGFSGVVVTDDLEMGAMQKHYGFDSMIREASAAGHDAFCLAHSADLQRRAARILREGLASKAPWFGDPDALEERLDNLRPLPPAGAPDAKRSHSVAEAISGRAITIIRDDRDLLPLPREGRIVLALPTLRSETGVENPLRGEEDGSVLVEALGTQVETVPLATEPSPEEIARLLVSAQDASHLLVVLTNARFLASQAILARQCVQAHPGTVLLLIRNPFDGEVVPATAHATVVASYGFRPLQLRALVRVLRGEVESYGRLPVTLQPLP
jgi:beta-N-acetylhexosaminidase